MLNATTRDSYRETMYRLHRKARLEQEIKNGVVLVGSDAHYWPGLVSTAHAGFVHLCRELKPKGVVLNGDVFDGATISRWARIGWDHRPKVKEELDACEERLVEIVDATRGALRWWTMGNHDARFETYLAAHAAEFEGVKFTSLKDHFPAWQPCWSLFINGNTAIKHRFKGGVHAAHNNTLWSGMSILTGHSHILNMARFSDYNGMRYGVQTGTLADPNGPQFIDYTEDNPKNWQPGFAVLTFHNGRLLQPEFAEVFSETQIQFRGKVHDV
jgi:hypothetical protein